MSKITKQASGKPRKIKPLPREDKSKRYLYPEYDHDMCIKLAGISAAAYRTPKAFVHQLRALDMPYYEYELVEKDNAQAYVVWGERKVIIAWRGTEPKEYKDVLADLKFRKVIGHEGQVHRGFKGYVDKVYDEVYQLVKEITKEDWYDVYVTGHSLGGASALICTNRLEDYDKFHVKACYTFGSPRPGGWKYANTFKTNVFRVRNNNDLVTKVPPSFFGYKHIGKLCYLDRNGKMHTGKVKWWTVFSNWVLGQFHRIGDGLRDHSIGEYYQILKNQK
tara:strand:- start:5784 stop:6614 length:831 start_codon:yes stop_codon:yes gene_type:complete